MQATSTNYSTKVPKIARKEQSNTPKLDLDWLGQQPIEDLTPRQPELLLQLAEARSELGQDDPFGTAHFDADTPVVVLLRALVRVADRGAASR